MAKIAVIVPAAGSSTRFGGKVKKPFALMGERAVFLRTLELFINRDDVCQTILAVSPDDYDRVKTKFGANLGFMSVKLVKGGNERYQTVRLALEAVDAEAELIAIHDAVRPCLTSDKISEVFAAAAKHGAALLASEQTATLKKVGPDGFVEKTVDRERLFMAQTPQVFKTSLIKDAYAKLPDSAKNITDDAQVAEMAGHKVFVVPSDPTNIKITVQSDLKLAQAILSILPKPKARGPVNPFEEAQW
ncbi:MAG: 2-C-methyl-D-erythritol 4-phosphate cytidylyltransferase [Phycisphaerae bacterium]|jgi:2-C-methyl-D-erythritol 4-phosphate cytidylyltransferase|nr:2-C-methyl-D-erythritol 4-phosphate cytidylyltransferase [Phycisphaerae bacterium]